jgi:SAM-dependent methyltransferase
MTGAASIVAIFTATTFLSALLLFSIQPLFAKMVLPILGGAPSVWAVALCFFQAALLAGYCYAHALNRHVPTRIVGFVHLGLFAVALLVLPIGLPSGWREPPPGDPYLWQLGLFTVAIGLPFMAIAANAPLLQAWFSRTGHPDGHDPYFLYGASNLGSFIALLAYPLVLEPRLGLTQLSRIWTIGFVLLALAIAVCFWRLTLTGNRVPQKTAASTTPAVDHATTPTPDSAPTWWQRLGWIGLALVPSALLTAYTTHIATDVASAPLIWVLPLSLYLLTFVLVFRERPLAFVPCLLAAAAAGYLAAPPLTLSFTRDPANAVALVGVVVAAAIALWAWRSNRLGWIVDRLPPARAAGSETSAPQSMLPMVLVAVAAIVVFVLIKTLAGLLSLQPFNAIHVLAAETRQWLSISGALLAAAVFWWGYTTSNASPGTWLLRFHLAAVVLALLQLSQTKHDDWFISAATGVAAFFLSGLVAHRNLYEARPSATHLTEFYLWMSLGGVLGGLFAALIAPKLFSEVLEYPILLALTMACRPGALLLRRSDTDEMLRVWLLAAVGLLAVWWANLLGLDSWLFTAAGAIEEALGSEGLGEIVADAIRKLASYGIAAVLAITFAVLVVVFARRPVRQFVAAGLMCLAVVMLPSSVRRGEAERSYFGIYRISESHDKQFQVLTHGTTLHGAQRIRDGSGALVLDTTPGTYYYPKSPMARTIELVRERVTAEGGKGRYGVVGLGTGSLSCLSKPGESWRFFEIDPVIVGIATNPEKFSFVSNCQPKFDVVLGDARLTLAKEPAGSFDLIIVDAFSSDAIPVHLMTAEAIRLYADKLKPNGVVLLHISNRYLDLDDVLAATTPLVPGLDGVILDDNEADGSYAASTSTVGVFSRSKEALAPFRKLETAMELPSTTMRGWTDDYSDILAPFLSKLKR